MKFKLLTALGGPISFSKLLHHVVHLALPSFPPQKLLHVGVRWNKNGATSIKNLNQERKTHRSSLLRGGQRHDRGNVGIQSLLPPQRWCLWDEVIGAPQLQFVKLWGMKGAVSRMSILQDACRLPDVLSSPQINLRLHFNLAQGQLPSSSRASRSFACSASCGASAELAHAVGL